MAQSLANLRAESQQRCNQEAKTLVSTAEWDRYIQEAVGELYDIIVSAFPHYYVSSSSFSLSAVNTFDLTTLSPTFYKLRGVDYMFAGTSRPRKVTPLNFAERNRYQSLNFSGNYTIWYTPLPPALVADGDTLDLILDNWSEFIPVTAAMAGASKENGDLTDLRATKAGIIQRINAAAPNRDGEPGQAADLMAYGEFAAGDSGRRYMLEGSNLVLLGTDSWLWA